MGLRGISPTTQLSAALTLATWIKREGRPPTFKECSAGNGLNHPDFYYRKLQASSFAMAIAMALDIANSVSGFSSGGVCQSPQKKSKPCLGACGTTIPDEGAHIRFCVQCRKNMKRTDPYDDVNEGYTLPRKTLRRLSYDFGGLEEMIQW